MLQYLIQLPYEALGQKMLGFLEMIDIIQLENAAASQKSKQLIRAILPYCPPIVVSDSWNRVNFNHHVCNWFSNRRCRVQFMRIAIESLCEVNLEHSVLHDIALCLNVKASLKDIESLNDPNIRNKITKLDIKKVQDPAVMEVLFSLLTNSSFRSLDIGFSNLSQWVVHVKKIGPLLHELIIGDFKAIFKVFKAVVEYCPYLEKLSLNYLSVVSDNSNILQSIASNCPHLRILHIINMACTSSTEADADLTAFAQKCPQLEELSLHCPHLTDQSVIALAQHCSRLKMLKQICRCKLTAASLIALSERGLPLEELDIPDMPSFPSVEIAAQCAHALSRIRKLGKLTYNSHMTGLREFQLADPEDHLLVPHLLLLLQGQCCAGLESLIIGSESRITPQQLCELVAGCPQLHTLTIYKPTCSSHTVLLELARSCPHLQKVLLYNSEGTEEGVLALAAHCRQLREIHLANIRVAEETVRQLAQHCRRLTELRVFATKGELIVGCYQFYSSKEIRALRETKRAVALRL